MAAAAAPTVAVAAQQTAEVDKACPKAGDKNVSVCAGHDVKLNQTNISANNNKFYILQVRSEQRKSSPVSSSHGSAIASLGATVGVNGFR